MQHLLRSLRARRDRGDAGFTLIELLVVVVIIGVLVAIAIPTYLNYRQGAADKTAQSDLRSAISSVEAWYTQNGNQYPDSSTGCVTGSLTLAVAPAGSTTSQTLRLSNGTSLRYTRVGTTSYTLAASNSGGKPTRYNYDSAVGGTPTSTDNASCT